MSTEYKVDELMANSWAEIGDEVEGVDCGNICMRETTVAFVVLGWTRCHICVVEILSSGLFAC